MKTVENGFKKIENTQHTDIATFRLNRPSGPIHFEQLCRATTLASNWPELSEQKMALDKWRPFCRSIN